MANICCSIELEPRTLKQGQLNQAREAAADAVQNSDQPALLIEGLMHAVDARKGVDNDNEGGDQVEKLVECMEKATFIDDKNCQCSCIAQSPDLKQPHSAPF